MELAGGATQAAADRSPSSGWLRGGPAGAAGAAPQAASPGGVVRYLPLDRIPVRPLPHRQHALSPLERGHPDVGVAVVDSRWGAGGDRWGLGEL